jgi:hypothetical protein
MVVSAGLQGHIAGEQGSPEHRLRRAGLFLPSKRDPTGRGAPAVTLRFFIASATNKRSRMKWSMRVEARW